ncbi:MAG: 3-isopropylmalate dehydrogenase [Candidatus Marinimicrobia bacterium]|jgi:3-isopropylmalate dehydrogenase|nr:3-isopropylmalate dehydrogenase [Candidatus Neomarinimicrobiota bacterium]MBT3502599.1 3-isopropylmalate dehydrogenase [Candidatus Neomarinimicrobiota bacterium]MBT3839253.1 3-isopropylmalate dehydrogenase [Candidatus Neomarinimicrobiota bacterium]MBT3999214.1 3-isopropylmalate dehydrogenase [Candidatus Neomarinimicrobiota bacterium]MBT4281914.1 3-isopropylmalate dehydrogenase [Candidatus Neomarinimicrobiota bacterium]
MKSFKITTLPGDGIGPEVMDAALAILGLVGSEYELNFEIITELAGGASFDKFNEPITESALQSCLESDAVLLGAVGGPKWDNLPQNKKPEKGLLKLREVLGLFSNLRPAKIFAPLADASSLKKDVIVGSDVMVVRELTGGIYFGEPRGHNKQEGFNTLRYKKYEVERIAKVAFELAKKRNGHVTSVDKANVLDSSQFWRDVVHEVHQDYKDVPLSDMYVDNAAMQLVRDPKQFDVILTQNLFGDILSDITAMITGSMGMLPSASIGENHAMYEPVHGTAPEIVGLNKANPIAMIGSVAMMLEITLNQPEAAHRINMAIETVLEKGIRTIDIASPNSTIVSTDGMRNEIIHAFQDSDQSIKSSRELVKE